MSIENLSASMTDDDRAKVARGADMLSHAHAGRQFDDFWVPIGEGLLVMRRTVMAVLRLKKPKGGYYNAAMGRLCANTSYAEMPKTDRSNLVLCMDHLADLVEMRAGWTATERAKINHPNSMAKHLRDFLKGPVGDDKPRRNFSAMASLKEKNDKLIRDNAELEERLAAATSKTATDMRDIFDWNDKAEDIVIAVAANADMKRHGMTWTKVSEVCNGLLAEHKKRLAGAREARKRKAVPVG
jgi:hypothetical protein